MKHEVSVTNLTFAELKEQIKELETIELLENLYCDEFKDEDYFSIHATKLS